ncbi:threonine/serine dehydratase [Rhodobacteraceae bacterium NNCM2]|nr:threonine/serine dehydratase [Coraliihabitans acroporae]
MTEITNHDISGIHEKITGHIRRTPVIEVDGLSLKLECLQHAGSFKPRGAFANILTREVPPAGLVAASGGNHGAAVAYAARQMGHRARIFVPEISSPAKVALIRRLGGDVVVTGAEYAEALAASEEYRAESGAMTIHAYDAWETVAGQATVGREFEEQADLDTVLVAVGGGGLIGGIAAWYAGRTKVVAVEPELSACFNAARKAGAPVDVSVGGVAADSLGARSLGAISFDIASRHVGESVLVPDDAIAETQVWCWHNLNLAVEPGGATALAALRAGRYRPAPGERVGVVMCGSNVDLAKLHAASTA